MRLRRLIPSLSDYGFILVIFILISQTNGGLLADGDALYHVRAGQWMIDHRSLPHPEPFSYGMGDRVWVAHEWASELAAGAVYEWFGLDGVCLLYLAVLGLTLYLLTGWIRKRWGIAAALAAMSLFCLSSMHWLARPHLWTYLGMVLYLIWIDRVLRKTSPPVWVFPAVMVIWSNLHGGFAAGLALLAIAWLHSIRAYWASAPGAARDSRNVRYLTIALLLSAAASWVNPYGAQIWSNTLRFAGDSGVTQGIQEFMSPNFRADWLLLADFWAVFAIYILSRERPNTNEWLKFFIFGVAAFQSVRHAPLFFMVSSDGVARRIRSWIDSGSCPAPVRNRLAEYDRIEASLKPGLWSVLACVAAVVWCASSYDFKPVEKLYPGEAIRYLQANPMPGNGFNTDEFGDYMIWDLWPGYRVFIDGRSDFYEGKRLEDYHKIIRLDSSWKDRWESYNFKWAFVSKKYPIAQAIELLPGWKTVYSDEKALIAVRQRI